MLRGSLVAIVTPMTPSGAVDWDALVALIEWHVDAGRTASSPWERPANRRPSASTSTRRSWRSPSSARRSASPSSAGSGANATTEAIELTVAAKEVGLFALLVDALLQQAHSRGLFLRQGGRRGRRLSPDILYNVPGRTCCDMLAPTVLRLAKVPNIVGIKEATGDMNRAREIIFGQAIDFRGLLRGRRLARELMLLGGDGTVSVTANVMPEFRQMCEAALEGDATPPAPSTPAWRSSTRCSSWRRTPSR